MAQLQHGFSRDFRVVRQTDFDRIYGARCSASDDMLLVFACRNGLAHSRLGISVSRKVGNAVARARWKRRIRDAFRTQKEDLPQGFDLVVIPRAPREPEMPQLRNSLVRVSARAARRVDNPRPAPPRKA